MREGLPYMSEFPWHFLPVLIIIYPVSRCFIYNNLLRTMCGWMNRSIIMTTMTTGAVVLPPRVTVLNSTCIILFNPYKNLWRQVLLLSSFSRQGNWNVKKLSDFPDWKVLSALWNLLNLLIFWNWPMLQRLPCTAASWLCHCRSPSALGAALRLFCHHSVGHLWELILVHLAPVQSYSL